MTAQPKLQVIQTRGRLQHVHGGRHGMELTLTWTRTACSDILAADILGRSDEAEELWTELLVQLSGDTGLARGSEALRFHQRA